MYSDAGFPGRVLAALGRGVTVARPFGVRVTLRFTAALTYVVMLLGLREYLAIGWGEALVLAAASWLALYLVVWTHEMGHVLAAQRYGVRTHEISLSALGGLAHLQQGLPGPRAEAVVSLAGPAVHLLWWLPLLLLHDVLPSPFATGGAWRYDTLGFVLHRLRDLNFVLLAFNLLPSYPLDGGRVLRALLASRMHPNRATMYAARVGLFGAVVIGVGGLALQGRVGPEGGLVLLVAVSLFLACRRELAMLPHSDGPYDTPSDPWSSDAEAWRSGRSPFGADADAREDDDRSGGRDAARAPPVRRRASPRAPVPGAAADTLRDAEPATTDARDLDRLLDRVSSVGLSGLTSEERDDLDRISRSRRRTPGERR